ncbi:MAG: hypothetical protein HZB46_13360 [Solirubrobacterales bacterium]|nr:hypothetical protein [Solirubrobacterales bacterium]
MRAVYVGQSQYFTSCVPPGADFVDHRGGADAGPMLRAVRALEPDVVVVFRPEIVPAGAFDGLPALTLGFNTEPLPRGTDAHPDQLWRLGELAQTDTGQFDRIITFDPLSAQAAHAAGVPVWRSLPLPVADGLYGEVRPMRHPPRLLFLGYSTDHRERWLMDVKHHFDLLHVAHGVHGQRLHDLFARTDVAINLHVEPYPSFENRVCLHLAAGHLVLSEPLSPTHGLEPGLDYVECETPRTLVEAIVSLRAYPGIFDAVRRRGRRKVEQFRASRVWPRVLADLGRDVAAFGTQRRKTARTTRPA